MRLSRTVFELLSLISQIWKRYVPWPRPLKGQSVILMLKHHMANQCTKFEVSSFSHSGDILGGSKTLFSRASNHITMTLTCLWWCWSLYTIPGGRASTITAVLTHVCTVARCVIVHLVLDVWLGDTAAGQCISVVCSTVWPYGNRHTARYTPLSWWWISEMQNSPAVTRFRNFPIF